MKKKLASMALTLVLLTLALSASASSEILAQFKCEFDEANNAIFAVDEERIMVILTFDGEDIEQEMTRFVASMYTGMALMETLEYDVLMMAIHSGEEEGFFNLVNDDPNSPYSELPPGYADVTVKEEALDEVIAQIEESFT